MGTLPLDDPRWYPLIAAIGWREQKTGDQAQAVLDLEQKMASGKLGCMRQKRATGERELVPAPFWEDHVIDFSISGSPTVYRRTAVDDTPRRWSTFAHAHLHLPEDRIYDLFFVWLPHLEAIWSPPAASVPVDQDDARDQPSPSPKEPTPQRRKRGRAGRKRSIPPEQIKEGVRILQSQDKMTIEAARARLRAEGIEGEDGPLYRLIIKPAYEDMPK